MNITIRAMLDVEKKISADLQRLCVKRQHWAKCRQLSCVVVSPQTTGNLYWIKCDGRSTYVWMRGVGWGAARAFV